MSTDGWVQWAWSGRLRAGAILSLARLELVITACTALVGLGWALRADGVQAQELPNSIPNALSPWVPWVRGTDDDSVCATRDDQALCFWSSELDLVLTGRGGTFSVEVQLDRQQRVRLPGGRGQWPEAVRVDGRALAVVDKEAVPALLVPSGTHRIEGRFSWAHLPEQLPIPSEFGLLRVFVEGRPSAFKRDATGRLQLRAAATPQGPAQIELSVLRKLIDAVPLRVESLIRLRVSGEPREQDLGDVLLPDSVPLSIDSELPARLEPSGSLRLSLRAGSYTLRVVARLRGPVLAVRSPQRPAPWPAQEAWVWQPDAQLRQVRLSGVAAVDPARLDLPQDMRGLPTFLVNAGETLQLEELSRGEPEPAPNQLALERTLWLDQDGRGYTVQDELHGELHSGFRLSLEEGALGRVRQGDQDLLITLPATNTGTSSAIATAQSQPDPQPPVSQPKPGVELRDVQVALRADSRLDEPMSSLPAVGWSEDVQSLGITLHLPPGYTLWAVTGADHVERTWLGDWNLFGFFLVLVVAFGTSGIVSGTTSKRRGQAPLAGVAAFVTLALTYHESDAPGVEWLWVLLGAALVRFVPQGRVWQVARGVFALALVTLAIALVPFASRSLREALYPQLAAADVDEAYSSSAAPSAASGVQRKSSRQVLKEALDYERSAEGRADDQPDSQMSPKRAQPVTDPEAVVQTGPGLPDWQFRRWQLNWSGPVAHGHRIQLWIAPPLLNRCLCALRVVLSGLLVWIIVAASGLLRRRTKSAGPPPLPLSAAKLALWLLLLHTPLSARAQFPDTQLLEQLRARVVRTPECRPHCVSIADARLQLGADRLLINAEVHAQDRSSVRVPGPLELWQPRRVLLDGQRARAVAHSDGSLHVLVTPGVHQLEAELALPATDTLTLRFADVPQRVRVQAQGYEVSGVREDGTSDDAIEFRRLLPSAQKQTLSLPPFFLVTRSLEFSDALRVHTEVERQSPQGSSQLLHLPLLAGESVHDGRVQLKDHSALVPLGPDTQHFAFDSTLQLDPQQGAQIELSAGPQDVYAERWRFACSPVWSCSAAGLTPVRHETDQRWQPEYAPWPTEHLQIALHKPPPAQGQTSTIDAATLRVRPGVRVTEADLTVKLRTSRGGDHQVTLPADARVHSLTVSGQRRAVRRDGAAYSFNMLPGSAEIAVQFQLPRGYDTWLTAPQVQLDERVKNARVVIEHPSDRWLLWARGPAWGPAILFWSYLALAVFVAFGLGLTRSTPLSKLDWVLLALGLTQISTGEALLVVGFFFALAYRAQALTLPPLRHNLLQIALVFWACIFAGVLFDAVQSGLSVQPDMQVMGAGSHGNTLQWYVDESAPSLPTPSVLSVPLWVYRVWMLAWSLWLARRLISWAPWVFRAFTAGGLSKSLPRIELPRRPEPAAPEPHTPPKTP